MKHEWKSEEVRKLQDHSHYLKRDDLEAGLNA